MKRSRSIAVTCIDVCSVLYQQLRNTLTSIQAIYDFLYFLIKINLKERINAIVTENRKSLLVERWALRPGGKRSMRCQREKKDPTPALTRTL